VGGVHGHKLRAFEGGGSTDGFICPFTDRRQPLQKLALWIVRKHREGERGHSNEECLNTKCKVYLEAPNAADAWLT